MTTSIKVHLELEPGIVLCGNRLANYITKENSKVTCGHCKKRIDDKRRRQFKKTIPF